MEERAPWNPAREHKVWENSTDRALYPELFPRWSFPCLGSDTWEFTTVPLFPGSPPDDVSEVIS